MELIVSDEAALRRPCEKTSLRDGRETGRGLVRWLERYNKKARRKAAIGIAAPQLGVLKKVCVTLQDSPRVFVNPRIIDHSRGDKIPWEESCLSFPGEKVETYRYAWVVVACDNWDEAELFGCDSVRNWNMDNLGKTVCVQHEIAHCYGLLHRDFATKEYPPPSEWESWRPQDARV